MSHSGVNSIGAVLARIKEAEGLRFDTDVAPFLKARPNQIGQWKTRGTVPYDRLIEYSQAHNVSLDWLLKGSGSQRIKQMVNDEIGHYIVKPKIDSDLFVSIGKLIDDVLCETDVDRDAEKRDRMVAIIYNDIIAKEGEQDISPEKVKELVKLAR